MQLLVLHKWIELTEVYLNVAVNQLGNFAENAHVTFRNDGAVFKPEVEQVAQKEHLVGIGFDAVKPPNETSFTLKINRKMEQGMKRNLLKKEDDNTLLF